MTITESCNNLKILNKTTNPNCKEIIIKYLDETDCECTLSDLMPCADYDDVTECKAGYKQPGSDADFTILGPGKLAK